MDRLSLIAMNEPHSIVAESYKMLRTNLHYMNVDNACRVMIFTSSLSGEGKTTSILNTAITFAQADKRVLVVDCDLRKANVHTLCNLNQSPGLTHYLADSMPVERLIQRIEGVENLHVITSGILPPNPAEILSTKKMEQLISSFRVDYDYIFIDSPPVLAVVDALVISKYADGVVLIAAVHETKVDALIRAKKMFEKVETKIVGVLMTKAGNKNKKYLYY